MKRLIVLITLIFLLTQTGLQTSTAFFGIGTCSKVKTQISKLETRIVDDINYLQGLQLQAISTESQQGVRIYERYLRLGKSLANVKKLGLENSKCFSKSIARSFISTSNWTPDWYVSVPRLSGKYFISSNRNYTRVVS